MERQSHPKRRIIIGVTGSFGSGKTTVAKMFSRLKAKVIDADRITHTLIKLETKIYKRIIKTFGKGILKNDRTIDRSKLAQIVFNNKILLKRLNKIVHPEVIRRIKKKLNSSPQEIFILDVPLLVEAGLKNLVNRLIVVKITRKKQIERIMSKTSLSKTDILNRINAQMPLQKKIRIADFVIDNNGTRRETKKQVKKIWRLLWKN